MDSSCIIVDTCTNFFDARFGLLSTSLRHPPGGGSFASASEVSSMVEWYENEMKRGTEGYSTRKGFMSLLAVPFLRRTTWHHVHDVDADGCCVVLLISRL